MGTNFYISTNNKEVRDKYFGYNYELTDMPDWGYQIHIAKTSMGWLPLFQCHDCFKSIKELKELYNTGHFIIYDEYGETYDWDQFDKRVLKHNGGVDGAIPKTPIKREPVGPYYDNNMPAHVPVSHFEYAHGAYAHKYFKDPGGFEFTNTEFS